VLVVRSAWAFRRGVSVAFLRRYPAWRSRRSWVRKIAE
jgi:hypothetical protein